MIQPLAIEKYSEAIKDKIIFDNFNLETFITGSKIKSLTKIPQINAFVIREIFDRWAKETEKLKSPYFDFDHPDVQNALKDFMNKLSFQIKIDKDHFEILLKEAIHDTFEYLENPIYFLQEEVFKFTGHLISRNDIKTKTKFLKLYPSKLEEFLSHSQINQDTVRLDVLMKVIEDVFDDRATVEQEKDFIEQLTSIVPNNFVSFDDQKPKLEMEEEIKKPITPKPIFVKKEEEKESKPVASVPIEKEKPVIRVEEEKNNKMPKFETEVDSSVSMAPISSISDSITLQQKFYFIKELFDKNTDLFEEVVDKSDSFPSYDEACNALWEDYAEKLNWMEKEEAVSEFFSIINRKFV